MNIENGKTLLATALLIAGLALAAAQVGATGGEVGRPAFTPSLGDKLGNDNLDENATSTAPLNESELVTVTLPRAWVEKNDRDPRGAVIRLTLSNERMNRSPPVTGPSMTLRVPRKMLAMDDTDHDPGTVTVSYPRGMFRANQKARDRDPLGKPGRTDDADLDTPPRPATALDDGRTLYDDRYWFAPNFETDITRITGKVTVVSNIDTEQEFTSYQEREIYMDGYGDVVEVISNLRSDGRNLVWVAVFDHQDWVTPGNWMSIEATPSRPVEYYVYMDRPGELNIWLHDTETGRWTYGNYVDSDDPSSSMLYLTGSSELYLGDITHSFLAITDPIYTEWVHNGSWQYPGDVYTEDGQWGDDPYVDVTGYVGSPSGLLKTGHLTYGNAP